MMNRNPLSAYHTGTLRRVAERRRIATQHMTSNEMARFAASAFTLVELLTVIAITIILLGLLFGPIIQGFNFTRRARAIAQAQDAARFGLERLSRELGSATFVYDNISSTITLPMQDPTVNRGIAPFAGITNNATTWPRVAFGRIDFVGAATRDAGQIKDPTTGQPIKGAEIRPFTRGTRVVRYFVGLRNSLNAAGTAPQYYQNIYEFPRTDDGFNPVVLYRAEFDPRDPNLFNLANYTSANINDGGFNDPNFFYNTNVNGANGQTLAANWRAIARPVLASQNADLTIWNRKGSDRLINDADPFKSAVTFAPATVAGDTATPGFLENSSAEAPGAVPSLYTTKYSQWAMPYRVTFLRGSTNYNGTARDPEPYGTLSLEIGPETTAGPNFGKIVVRNAADPLIATGSLAQGFDTTKLYVAQLANSGKLFVKTPHLAFIIDPERGRIETGLPPVEGQSSIPTIFDPTLNAGAGAPRTMNPGAVADFGELIETRYVSLSRMVPQAGTGTVPPNQGIVEADMFAPARANGSSLISGYIAADTAPVAYNIINIVNAQSPLDVFGTFDNGGSGNLRGIMVVAGSERLVGPDPSSFVMSTVVPYNRAQRLTQGLNRQPSQFDLTGTAPYSYASDPGTPAAYLFESNVFDRDTDATGTIPLRQAARLFFRDGLEYDESSAAHASQAIPSLNSEGQPTGGFAGLPARRSTEPTLSSDLFGLQRGTGRPVVNDSYIQATYLWQNNYARDQRVGTATYGQPLTADDVLVRNATSDRPEADVVKVDYSTRTLINISLGARIYDISNGAAQAITISDKVQVNNVGR